MSLLLALTAAGGPTNYADNLSAGAYVFSGKPVSDSVARADALSTGTYSISGKSVTDVYARNDALSIGAYSVSGKNITDIVARADSLSSGSYVISGKTVEDAVARADNLSVGSYIIVGKDITDAKTGGTTAYADDLNPGSYAIHGQQIIDLLSRNDNISAGAYILAGYGITDFLVQTETAAPGGSGWPYLPTGKKTKTRRFDDDLAIAIREIYEGVEEPEIVKQAAKIVQPFVKKGIQKTAVPSPETIDWSKLEKDAEKVSALLNLWQEQLESLEDEEMCILMSTL